MLGLLLMLRRFFAAFRTAWRDLAFRGITVSIVVLVTSATTFYTLVEGWSVLDSLYFSVVTGLTIGYGDLAPQEALSKVFTMVYALLAVGLFVAFGTSLARALVAHHAAKPHLHRRHRSSPEDQD
ncbi:potassium channel family protein [Phytoactinopolyspora endophytica]|uniref:potassium channel family protein n=1 Tax=Phytoactinopolyspora endophytica TaxID=1642495 RepID=UPI00101C8529|nr:potassium channel family protein [Phytoactinopolyspora endophytica]